MAELLEEVASLRRGSTPPISTRPAGGGIYRLVARMRDVAAALLGLLLLSPLFLILGIATRRATGGSALFRQARLGGHGKRFEVIKFRTLKPEAPAEGKRLPDLVVRQLSPPLGNFMRRYKLDELPQLWNVLKGEMSLVGPRPHQPEEWGNTPRTILAIRPGLTGLWQLSRGRDVPFDEHLEYNLFYLFNRSLAFDLWLLWRTFLLLLFGKTTKIRLAARLWERDTSWRGLIPKRARAIPHRTGQLRSRVWAAFLLGATLIALLPSGVMAFLAKRDLQEGRRALESAREAVRTLELDKGSAALDSAEASFERASSRLNSWVAVPGRLTPVFRQNLRVGQALAVSGRQLVSAGRQGLEVARFLPYEGGRISAPWQGGRLLLDPFIKSQEPASRIEGLISEAVRRIRLTDSPLLLPFVSDERRRALKMLTTARREAEMVRASTVLIPSVFGLGGPRTWLVSAENLSELRGRGGYLGAFGTIEASSGEAKLGSFQSASDLPGISRVPLPQQVPPEYTEHYNNLGAMAAWQNLGMSPHFPSVASLLIDQMAAAGLPKASGLISMDPVALSYLMEVSGPLRVEGISDPLTSANVVDWALNRQYYEFAGEYRERKEVLGEVAEALWRKLLSSDGLDPTKLSKAFGRALSERHITVYSTDPTEQKMIETLGIGGTVEKGSGDYLMVVSQNLGENKMDYYVDREIAYRGEVGPDGVLTATLEIGVRNTARPDQQLPDYVGGARPELGVEVGEARSYVSVFVPARSVLGGVILDGSILQNFDNRLELGKRVFATEVRVRPGESRRITFRYIVPRAMSGNRYELTVQKQATVRPDKLSVDIQLPSTALVTLGDKPTGGGRLVWEGPLMTDKGFALERKVPVVTRLLARVRGLLREPLVLLGG